MKCDANHDREVEGAAVPSTLICPACSQGNWITGDPDYGCDYFSCGCDVGDLMVEILRMQPVVEAARVYVHADRQLGVNDEREGERIDWAESAAQRLDQAVAQYVTPESDRERGQSDHFRPCGPCGGTGMRHCGSPACRYCGSFGVTCDHCDGAGRS